MKATDTKIIEQEPATASELLYDIVNYYLHVQRTDDGFDYTLYDKDTGREIDGGQLDSDLPLIKDAAAEICSLHDLPFSELQLADIAILDKLVEPESDFPNKNTVWVLRWDWKIDSGESGDGCEVYATKEAGLKAFDAFVDEVKNVDYADDFEDFENSELSIQEEPEGYFSIWRDGYYELEHTTVALEEHIVQEEA